MARIDIHAILQHYSLLINVLICLIYEGSKKIDREIINMKLLIVSPSRYLAMYADPGPFLFRDNTFLKGIFFSFTIKPSFSMQTTLSFLKFKNHANKTMRIPVRGKSTSLNSVSLKTGISNNIHVAVSKNIGK